MPIKIYSTPTKKPRARLSDFLFARAVRKNNFNVIDERLKQGVNINGPKLIEDTYLYFAMEANNLNMVRYLLKKGANINFQDVEGQTYLHVAAVENEIRWIEYLLTQDLNLEAQNKSENTCLGEAILAEKIRMVRFLLKKGANIHHRTKLGISYLHMLGQSPFMVLPSLIDVLVEAGIDVNGRDEEGKTALHYYIEYPVKEEFTRKLIKYGADISNFDHSNNKSKCTPVVFTIQTHFPNPPEGSLHHYSEEAFSDSDDELETNKHVFDVYKEKTLAVLGFPVNTTNCHYTEEGVPVAFRIKYSPELKNFLGYHVEESQIPAALRTVALYSHYDQHEVYRQQRADYLKSISASEDPDAYYTLAFLCIYFPQRFVMHALAEWKDPEKNTFSNNIKKVFRVGTDCYWNTSAVRTTDNSDNTLDLLKRFPSELLDFLVYSANTPASVEKTLAQLPRIKSKVLESTDSRNEFRRTMYADNYSNMVSR